MSFRGFDLRDRRNILNYNMSFGPMQYHIANYSTDSRIEKKPDMKFDQDILEKIHAIPDPLKKNLGDTGIHIVEKAPKTTKMSLETDDYFFGSHIEQETQENQQNSSQNSRSVFYPSLAGISNFFTSVFGAISGAMFTKRPKSPDMQYYDCFEDTEHSTEMSLNHWQTSKIDELNKTLGTESSSDDMSDYRAAVAQCESKLNAVRNLLSSESVPKTTNPSRLRLRRPRKIFIPPNSVQDAYVDEYATEQFISLANEEYIEYFGIRNNINSEACEVKAETMKTEAGVKNKDIIQTLPVSDKISSSTCVSDSTAITKSDKEVETTDIVKVLPDIIETKSDCQSMKSEMVNSMGIVNNIDSLQDTEIVKPVEVSITSIKNSISNLKVTKPTSEIEVLNSTSKTEDSSTKNSNLETIRDTEIVKPVEISTSPVKKSISNTETTKSASDSKVINLTSKSEGSITNSVALEKKEVITSCEDKMAKLKSLLQSRKQKNRAQISTDTSSSETTVKTSDSVLNSKSESPSYIETKPVTILKKPLIMEPTHQEIVSKRASKEIPIQKPKDRRFKNPNRLTDKRKRCRVQKNIQEDMLFANEIDSEDLSDNSPRIQDKINSPGVSSVENSPLSRSLDRVTETSNGSVEEQYFDELTGRFHPSAVTESEDSFQIVFADIPKATRLRRASDCESEDSFIVFEDSPDSCYTSNDVFGESDTEITDSESEISDSGCGEVCKLPQSMSMTISDLTDDTLYEDQRGDDEIDCPVRTFEELPVCEETETKQRGLLIDGAKKLQRKDLPPKKVHFSEAPPKVHVMRVWAFAARQARAGHWERHALDRERFKRRIADVDMAVSWVLKPQHRSRIMFQRFMPWWNQLKRKELAEKKEKERLRLEEEQKRIEAEKIAEEIRFVEEKIAEEKRLAEEKIAEEIRMAAEKIAEEKRLKEEKLAEEQRRIEEEKQKQIEEKLAKENRQKEIKLAEENRRKEAIKIAEERWKAVKLAQEQRQIEAGKLAVEKRQQQAEVDKQRHIDTEKLGERKGEMNVKLEA